MNETTLLDRARRGEEEAFSQLFARYQRAIHHYAAYMCGVDAGDDIVQETFLVVLRQTARYDSLRSTVISYLFGIARHVVMKRLAARNDVSFVDAGDDLITSRIPAEQSSALEELTRAETIASVRTAVHSLPSAYREVVVLCELQEMDYATAALVMECPIGTVRSRLNRARTLLTSKLAVMGQPANDTRV